MAVWPVSLVQQPKANGYEETYLESAVHSGMSVGRKNRLLDPSVIKTYTVKIATDDDGRDVLYQFWSDTIQNGTDAFDWVKFDDGSTAHSYKMLSDPDMNCVGAGLWEASLKLIDADPQRTIDTTVASAVSVWPASLPQGSDVGGLREAWNGYSLRSGLMPGKTQRARSSLTERRVSTSCLIDLTQKHTFESWYEDDLGLGSMPFTHDGWNAGVTDRYVMLAPPKFSGVGAGLFKLSIEVVTL